MASRLPSAFAMDEGTLRPIGPAVDAGTTTAPSRRVRRPLSSHGETSQTLPPELIAEASWRLGWLGLVYAAAVIVGHFGRRALLVWNGSIDAALRPGDVITAIAIAMGVAIYVVSRRGVVPPKQLLDIGLVFEVAGAFGIGAVEFLTRVPELPSTSLDLIPGECVWIVAYPFIVPNTPHKVLVASLVAASMGPATFAFSALVTGTTAPGPTEYVPYFFPNYLSALVAYAAARIVHRFGVRLKHAREIGSYELIERIGEGGMGEVWRARHRLLARTAALKLIRTDVFGTNLRVREAMVRRFEREAKDTAALGSTHTIDVYDFGVTEEGDFYYVMEILDGISFDRFVELFGPMEPARVVYLLQQVCHSLGEAHARGLVHRDIKPANIFMCRLGPDHDFVKVLDFGLVKHLDVRAGEMLTVEGMTAGTPAYMAPEIALGQADVDGRADIYSLACVAYFLLTAQPVFTAETAIATALAHINEQPVAPSARSEFDIPPALDALILECLAKDPAARPASAFALARRLAAIVPSGAWTDDAAQRWWELHGVSLAAGAASSPSAESSAEADTPGACVRCWPRLDRETARHQLA